MKKFALDSIGLTVLNAFGWLAAFGLFAAIAGFFGANWQTDAFFLAWTIPALFIGSIANVITSAFIPILSKYKIDQPEILGEITGSAIIYVTIISVVISLGIGLTAPFAFRSANPDLSDQSHQLLYQILLFLLPMISFQMANAVLAAMYNVFGIFWLPACSLIIRYIATLVLIFALRSTLGIMSIPISLLLGSVISTTLLTLFWSRLKIRITLKLHVNSEVNQAFRVALPLILGMFALQFSVVVTRFLAARLPSGNVSVLDYANRVSVGMMELLTSGVFLVTLTNWSSLVAEGDEENLGHKIGSTIRMVLFVVAPALVVLLVLREPVISILFQRGEFDLTLTQETSAILIFFLVGIPLDVVGRTYVQVFLAWQRTSGLAVLAVLRVFTTIFTSLALIDSMGAKAIALADTFGIGIVGVGLFLLAKSRTGNLLKGQGIALLKLSFSAFLGGLIAFLINRMLGNNSVWIRVPVVTIVSIISYISIAWQLRVEELSVLWRLLSGKPRVEVI